MPVLRDTQNMGMADLEKELGNLAVKGDPSDDLVEAEDVAKKHTVADILSSDKHTQICKGIRKYISKHFQKTSYLSAH